MTGLLDTIWARCSAIPPQTAASVWPIHAAQSVPLRLPLERKRFPQSVELPFWRLPPIKDHFCDVGSKQSESEHICNLRHRPFLWQLFP